MKLPTVFVPDKDLSYKINELLRRRFVRPISERDFPDRWTSANLEFLVNEECRDFLIAWTNLVRPTLISFTVFKKAIIKFMEIGLTPDKPRIPERSYYSTLALLPNDILPILKRHEKFLLNFKDRDLLEIYSHHEAIDVLTLYKNVKEMILREFTRFRKVVLSIHRLVQDDDNWIQTKMHIPERGDIELDGVFYFGNPYFDIFKIICELGCAALAGVVTLELLAGENTPDFAYVMGIATWATLSARFCLTI